MSRLRVAIVGAGVMGRWHADAARHTGAEVVAVVDPDLARARRLAGAGTLACATLAEALNARIDVVHVCTPLDSHLTLSVAALQAGCHVIVEKPVAPTVAEATRLLEVAREARRLVVPVHQFGFQAGVRKIIERRHKIGPLRHIDFATCSAGADRPDVVDRDLIAAEIAPHVFSLARALLPGSVGSLPWRLDRAGPGEWRFTAVAPEGCVISGLISLSARPTFATLRVLGQHGSATADLFHGFAHFEPDTASRQYKVVRPLVVGFGTAWGAARQLGARAVRRERAYPGLRALCDASYAAAAGRARLPFRDDEVIDVASGREQLLRLALQQRHRSPERA